MKTKKFTKKLTLNKNTIADLSNGHLGIIKGGIDNTDGDFCEIPPTGRIGCTVRCTVTCISCTCPSGGLAYACCPPTVPAETVECIYTTPEEPC